MAHNDQNTAVRKASKLLDVSYIVPLDEREARQVADSIKGHLRAADDEIIALHDRQGWKALGYTSWKDCIQAEFDVSRGQGYRLLAAARVRKNVSELSGGVSPIGDTSQRISEAVARELQKVPAELQAEVIRRAVAEYRNDFPSAKQVSAIVLKYYTPKENGNRVYEFGNVTRPAPKPSGVRQQKQREQLVKWAREAPIEAVERLLKLVESEQVAL